MLRTFSEKNNKQREGEGERVNNKKYSQSKPIEVDSSEREKNAPEKREREKEKKIKRKSERLDTVHSKKDTKKVFKQKKKYR